MILLYGSAVIAGLLSVPSYAETRQMSGMRGLNTVPDARFDPAGTVTLTLSHVQPYTHGVLGAQFTERFYAAIRQSAEESNPLDDPIRLYPGMDFKIKLWGENKYLPQAALGLQSAFSHKRMAGEYLALSKRWHNFDATAGLGWGRFGSAGHFDNPLKVLPHFGKERQLDGEGANSPDAWFTGEQVGIFGGLSYATPIKGLSLTADWNADRYRAETAINDDLGEPRKTLKEAPAPWALGVQYQPTSWLNGMAGVIGGDTFMTRITLSPQPANWPGRASGRDDPMPLRPYPAASTSPNRAMLMAKHKGRRLEQVTPAAESGPVLTALLPLEAHDSTPLQIGRAARSLFNASGPEVAVLYLRPRYAGLQRPAYHYSPWTLYQRRCTRPRHSRRALDRYRVRCSHAAYDL